ncbi:MAG TPA: CBS domain-containing protein [Magnetovibrio sp.]
MDCKSVMAPIAVRLYADEPVGDVIDFMMEKHMGLVPVTNRDGTFAGMVSGDHLMKFLLPQVLSTVGTGVHRATMTAASYLDESATEMQERLDDLRARSVGEVLEHGVETVAPDTPLIDALMKIKAKQYVVPVVDGDRMLLGAISFFSVLYALREEYDREETARQLSASRGAQHNGEG